MERERFLLEGATLAALSAVRATTFRPIVLSRELRGASGPPVRPVAIR